MAKKPSLRQLRRPKMLISLKQATLLRRMCETRIERLQQNISRAAGGLYPRIWENEKQEVRDLFEFLTGYPLEDR